MISTEFDNINVNKYRQTFKDYFAKSTRALGPRILFNRFKELHGGYDGYTQEDAQEYLTFIIDDLDTLINDSHLKELMVVQTGTCITCQHCGFFLVRKTPTNILTLSVHNNNNLIECLDEFVRVEMLQGDDRWNCEKCKCKRDAERRTVITKLPKYLFISLNRYEYLEGAVKKSERNIDIPLSWRFKGSDYVLNGIICHMGNSQNGHYISFVKRETGWHYVNDKQIEAVQWEEVQKTFPLVYVLLYTRT
jgi:ubiquitin C-terminal hydrolase